MKAKTIISLAFAVLSALADGQDTLAFDTVASVARARRDLTALGIRPFMENVWSQGVAAPGIHSKYWADRFTRNDPELAALETAYRDFGLDLLKQTDQMALETFRRPDRALEMERLDWYLRFAEWIRTPGKFENYRIASRVEDAATVPLLRVIVDMTVREDIIERQIARFSTVKTSAPVRAQILFEESNGTFDVRGRAEATKDDDDGFVSAWTWMDRRAYWHFGRKILRYTEDAGRLKGESDRYAFFADDSIGSPYGDSTHWDRKLHKAVCVYRSQAPFLKPIKAVFAFRKLAGRFSDVPVPAGKREFNVYADWYGKEYDWMCRRHGVDPSIAGMYYVQNKRNTYIDQQTRDLLSFAERMACAKQNVLEGPL